MIIAFNILDSFTAPAHNKNLRVHRYKLFVPYSNTNIRKNFFRLRLLPIWNVLPSEIVGSKVCSAFAAPAHNRNFRSHHYKLIVPFSNTNIRKEFNNLERFTI